MVWLDHEEVRGSKRAVLRVAPLSVANLLRNRLFDQATVILTSATLTIGGNFDAMATVLGPHRDRRRESQLDGHRRRIAFDHAKSGILYVAAHLPPPGRDGTGSPSSSTRSTA